MKDLKVRVANEAENKEAQELFFELGYYWAYKNLGKKLLLSKKDVYLFAESDGTLGTGTHQDEVFFNNWFGREITLQELRDMVTPMKEYLEKQADGSYKLVMRGIVGKDDDIEVPEGAEVATICRNYIIFWKDEKYSFSVSEENKWCYKSCDDSRYFSLGEYMNEYGDVSIIWRREQDEPFLTPETTLNDQYAEIEQVRQSGMKFDSNKPRHSLLPKGAVNSVIDVLEFGAKKYSADNWQEVDNAEERYYNAAMRHIDLWWNGEKRDPETGIHHLAHAATNLFFLMWFDNK